MTRLTLYHRPGCHLCDDMLDELEALCRGRQVSIELVDVDGDPRLGRRFGRDIPVLTAGDREICRHRLDAGAVLAALAL